MKQQLGVGSNLAYTEKTDRGYVKLVFKVHVSNVLSPVPFIFKLKGNLIESFDQWTDYVCDYMLTYENIHIFFESLHLKIKAKTLIFIVNPHTHYSIDLHRGVCTLDREYLTEESVRLRSFRKKFAGMRSVETDSLLDEESDFDESRFLTF